MGKKAVLLAAAVAFFITAASCSLRPKNQVRNPGELGQYDVVVVGKVVFDPPLTEDTQGELGPSDELFYRKTVLFVCSDELRKLVRRDLEPVQPAVDPRISAYEGEVFYHKHGTSSFYILSGVFYKEVTREGSATKYLVAPLPASFYIDITPSDRAVYIGTIKYYRDNFFKISKIEIADEYDAAMPLFRRMFGTMKLTKRLIRQPRKGEVPEIGLPY